MSLPKIYAALLWLSCAMSAYSQSVDAPLNADYYHLLDRYEIRGGRMAPFDTNMKPYGRKTISRFLDSLSFVPVSSADRFNVRYLAEDNWPYADSMQSRQEKPVLKYLYKHRRDFWHVRQKDFQLSVNPVLYLHAGHDAATGLTYVNTRGIQLEGMIDEKVAFYSYIGENQMLLPGYVNEQVRQTLTVPQEGFWKGYGNHGVDFLTARAHINVNATRHIGLQLGHGKHFIGNGYRSLVLSDVANNYLYLRINTQIWKLQYTNIFAKMTAQLHGNPTGLYGTVDFPAKYFTFHRLGINISDKLNIGLFESIVHGDSTQRFDPTYLNPVIFYRAVEQQDGSPGNALLGMDVKWLLFRHVSLYGQAVLDEFVLSEIRGGQGWWGNKYALQAGLKYMDAFRLPNLDIQLEYNRVRPYTYSHEDLYHSYSHYQQPLAHPLGANFRESLLIIRYQPAARLNLKASLTNAVYGADTASLNWGGNILLDNRTREQEYDNVLEQGVRTSIVGTELQVSYHCWHNLFADIRFTSRQQQALNGTQQRNDRVISAGIRLNIASRSFD